MEVRIVGSEKNQYNEVRVYFGNENTDEWYYTHGIAKIGEPTDADNLMNTMWSWINHMRHKMWWNPALEARFITEVKKYL